MFRFYFNALLSVISILFPLTLATSSTTTPSPITLSQSNCEYDYLPARLDRDSEIGYIRLSVGDFMTCLAHCDALDICGSIEMGSGNDRCELHGYQPQANSASGKLAFLRRSGNCTGPPMEICPFLAEQGFEYAGSVLAQYEAKKIVCYKKCQIYGPECVAFQHSSGDPEGSCRLLTRPLFGKSPAAGSITHFNDLFLGACGTAPFPNPPLPSPTPPGRQLLIGVSLNSTDDADGDVVAELNLAESDAVHSCLLAAQSLLRARSVIVESGTGKCRILSDYNGHVIGPYDPHSPGWTLWRSTQALVWGTAVNPWWVDGDNAGKCGPKAPRLWGRVPGCDPDNPAGNCCGADGTCGTSCKCATCFEYK